jgi:hypothetical protein
MNRINPKMNRNVGESQTLLRCFTQDPDQSNKNQHLRHRAVVGGEGLGGGRHLVAHHTLSRRACNCLGTATQ